MGFGSWLALILFGQFLLPIIANTLFPANTTGTANDYFASTTANQLFLRISPATLYQDIVTAVMNPATNSANVLGFGNLGQYVSAQQQMPTMLLDRPEHPAGVAPDRDPDRADRRDVRARLRPVPAPGGPRLGGRHASVTRATDTVAMNQPASAVSVAARPEAPVAPAGLAAIAGAVSALVALAVGELFAGLIAGVPSPIAAVGAAIIDFAPPGSKDFMVGLFGTNDKVALTVFVVAVVVLVGAGVGLLARRSMAAAIGVILAIVGVGLLASMRARRQHRHARRWCRPRSRPAWRSTS